MCASQASAYPQAQPTIPFDAPVPVILHIVSVTIYSLLGAFQFAPGFRRRRPDWHRAAGRVLVVTGLGAALSGLWMAMFFPIIPADNALLRGFRLFFGSAMAVLIVLGYVAIRWGDVLRHRTGCAAPMRSAWVPGPRH